MNPNQVGTCSVELKTTAVKPSLVYITLCVIAITFVASVLLATFLPYLVRFSTGVLS